MFLWIKGAGKAPDDRGGIIAQGLDLYPRQFFRCHSGRGPASMGQQPAAPGMQPGTELATFSARSSGDSAAYCCRCSCMKSERI